MSASFQGLRQIPTRFPDEPFFGGAFSAHMVVSADPGENGMRIEQEKIRLPQGRQYMRDREGVVHVSRRGTPEMKQVLHEFESAAPPDLRLNMQNWQFLSMQPEAMGMPTVPKLTRSAVKLNRDGSNLGRYLLDIFRRDPTVFNGIVETVRSVLPYLRDVQPTMVEAIQRTVYLQMTEGDFKVPGWLLSTGTARILGLLAVLRNPDPPPVLVVEEIENGLDPATIHMMVGEIQNAVESGRTQVLLTTHSPYLLDLLPLSSIVLVERLNGEPTFQRPGDAEEVKEWAKRLSFPTNGGREEGAA